MYENMTYEVILQRMLDRVPDTMNKREGSIIFDALAPAAVELTLAYMQFDMVLNESFGDTASRDYSLSEGQGKEVFHLNLQQKQSFKGNSHLQTLMF